MCSRMLHMFYQSAVASVLFYAAVCWEGSVMDKDAKRLNKLVKKAGSVLGARPDSLESVMERGTQKKMQAIMDNVCHPLHKIMADQKSGRKDLFRSMTCRSKRFKNTFIPSAIRLFNSTSSR